MRWSILRQRSRSVARRRYKAAVELRCWCEAFELPGNMVEALVSMINSNNVMGGDRKPHSRHFRSTHRITGRSKPWLDSTPPGYYGTTLFSSLTSNRAPHESFCRVSAMPVHRSPFRWCFLTCALGCTAVPVVRGQSPSSRFEVGGQFSDIKLIDTNGNTSFSPGFGGRFDWNITPRIALDTQVDFFPRSTRPRRSRAAAHCKRSQVSAAALCNEDATPSMA